MNMKFLKWLLYIVLAVVTLILVIPLFMPATVEISAEQEVGVSPAQVFHNAASYTDRNEWDPWLETEPEAAYTIDSRPDYVGSEYSWSGEQINTGRMVVDSVVFGKYIASQIYFGDDPDPGLVEWTLEESGSGTLITWKFTAETAYPVERLMLNLMKGQMLESFEKGLSNFAEYLEENPPVLSTLGKIEEGVISPMYTLVIPGKATMEEMGQLMEVQYGKLAAETERQQLDFAGPPFAHDLSYDEVTGITEYLAGVPVATRGKSTEEVKAKTYREIRVIQAMHSGPYHELGISYAKFMAYLEENGIEVSGESFEFYLGDPTQEPNPTKWKTLIAFPLK